jgi:hypothetical protein
MLISFCYSYLNQQQEATETKNGLFLFNLHINILIFMLILYCYSYLKQQQEVKQTTSDNPFQYLLSKCPRAKWLISTFGKKV